MSERDGGARRQTGLEKAPFSVAVKVLGVVDLIGLDDAKCLEKTVLRLLIVGPVLWLGKLSSPTGCLCKGT